MLENLDLPLIFSRTQEAGYSYCHLYAERTATTEFEICDKENNSRHYESGGLSVELRRDGESSSHTFRTNSFSTSEILNLIGLEETSFDLPSPRKTPQSKNASLGSKLQKLNLLVRKINLENSLTAPVSFWFQEKTQEYQSAIHPNEIKSGVTEQGEIKIEVKSSHKGKPLFFSHHFSTGRIEELWSELEKLLPQIQRRIQLGSTEQWPAPMGAIQIGWSAQSVAKLVDCFLRGFESDLVLKNFSYVTRLQFPLNFRFSIKEQTPPPKQETDHQGSLRRAMLIFDGNRPNGLATDKLTAQELNVSSTGHSRRESFDVPSTISFWHPVLESPHTTDCVLALMSEGLWVEEVDIKEWDLSTGMATLYFSQVNLVHQGEIGESVRPFLWTVSLLDIMSRMTHFSKETHTTGIFHTKLKQRILTQYTTAAALASPLEIPGSVPKSHYWG